MTAGTTKELRDLDQKFKLGMRLQVVNTHADGYARVTRGEADAFATDDVLLYGSLAQQAGGGAEMVVVGDYLSYDPYAIMFRKDDPQLAQLVKDSFQVLAEDGEIERQYRRWFLRKLPTGASLDLPMSAQLQTLIETMAIKSITHPPQRDRRPATRTIMMSDPAFRDEHDLLGTARSPPAPTTACTPCVRRRTFRSPASRYRPIRS